MGIGGMHKVVVFKKNVPYALGAGGRDYYTTLVTTRGRLKKLSGSRGLGFGEISQDNTWELIVRLQTIIESALRTDLKVEIDGRTFTVNSWELVNERRFYYKFILSEQTI